MRPAWADLPHVVVLPFVTADQELVIYGKPVADAVAGGLKGVGEIAVSSDARGGLIVGLRVSRVKGKVRIDATVRDSEVGQAAARVAARPVALAALDQAAIELSKLLRQPLADAGEARKHRQSKEKEAVTPA